MAKVKMYCKDPATSSGGKITWHKAPTMYVTGTITFERKEKNDSKIYVTGKLTNSILSGSYYNYKITASIKVSGDIKKEITVCTASQGGSGSGEFNFNFEYTGTANAECHIYCNGGGTHKCSSSAGDFKDIEIGQVDLGGLPYSANVKPTNVSSGQTYNQNGVQNGDEKPDRSFYCTWTDAKPGKGYGSIERYDLNLFKEKNPDGTIVATINDAKKNTRYTIMNLPYSNSNKFFPGDTIFVYINTKMEKDVDGSKWLRKKIYRKMYSL